MWFPRGFSKSCDPLMIPWGSFLELWPFDVIPWGIFLELWPFDVIPWGIFLKLWSFDVIPWGIFLKLRSFDVIAWGIFLKLWSFDVIAWGIFLELWPFNGVPWGIFLELWSFDVIPWGYVPLPSVLQRLYIRSYITLCLLVSSTDNICKQFGLRSGPTKCRAWSGSKLFDTLMVFLKEFFKKADSEKNQQTTKKHEKLPSRQS